MTGETRFDRAAALRWAVAAAAAAGLPAAAAGAAREVFPQAHPPWRFAFINHAVTNPFFVPTRYGIEDASAMLGVGTDWWGSRRSDVGEMVRAMERAVTTRVDGIAISLIDPTHFNGLTEHALSLKIPVIAYNADGGRGNKRLAYVGQDLYESGLKFGARIVELVGKGDVFVFIATPGQQNIQPRVDGALDAIRDAGRPIRVHVVDTGADVRGERKKIEATYHAHKGLKGLFAVDGGSTQGVAQVMRAHGLHRKGVRAGGYDLLPETLHAIHDGQLDFTIDQQPYLQGFVPILQLFLVKYSGGLVAPADTNTGLLFVTRANVQPYVTTKSRFEGSSKVGRYPL
jgi:simple sugar transport system substrate-binding protein